jgi:NAD(P)-dependent dehydrogenase (short-subunit alcohol dehydrogenase family)
MAQTMAVNAIAPFVMCSKLKPKMMPPFPLNDNGKKIKKNKNNTKNKNSHQNGENENGENSLDSCYSHIVNVTALEGKFNVGKKSGGHPHTVSSL